MHENIVVVLKSISLLGSASEIFSLECISGYIMGSYGERSFNMQTLDLSSGFQVHNPKIYRGMPVYTYIYININPFRLITKGNDYHQIINLHTDLNILTLSCTASG